MSDAKIRALERAAKYGDPEARERLLTERRRRSGHLWDKQWPAIEKLLAQFTRPGYQLPLTIDTSTHRILSSYFTSIPIELDIITTKHIKRQMVVVLPELIIVFFEHGGLKIVVFNQNRFRDYLTLGRNWGRTTSLGTSLMQEGTPIFYLDNDFNIIQEGYDAEQDVV